jgi:hypothetical protein
MFCIFSFVKNQFVCLIYSNLKCRVSHLSSLLGVKLCEKYFLTRKKYCLETFVPSSAFCACTCLLTVFVIGKKLRIYVRKGWVWPQWKLALTIRSSCLSYCRIWQKPVCKKGMRISVRCCKSPICVLLIMIFVIFKFQYSKKCRNASFHMCYSFIRKGVS